MSLLPLALLNVYLPDWMNNRVDMVLNLSAAQWLSLAAAAVAAYLIGWLLQMLVLTISRMLVSRTEVQWDNDVVNLLPGPLHWFLTLLLLAQLIALLDLPFPVEQALRHVLSAVLIVVLGWFVLRLLRFATRLAEAYFTRGLENTPQARAIHTQVAVVRMVLRFLAVVVTVALALLQFEVARSVGVSLLASAGVVGVAAGFAAQRTVSTLFAGIQIAFTKTIKIGDVIVVEGQFGTVEDITLTYVVVKIWDLRRLILPVTYFTEKPFENWTTQATEVMGTVFIYTDYSVPVDDLRAKVRQTLADTPLWDGKVQSVSITELQASNVQIRILVSAPDSGKLWDLRCLLREHLLEWLQSRGQQHLPRQRIQTRPTELDGLEKNDQTRATDGTAKQQQSG